MKNHPITGLGALAALLSVIAPLEAQEPPATEVDQAAELAKKLANPVASLVPVPFQANYDFGIGVNDVERFTLNFQPVTPFSINDDWNLIVRTILTRFSSAVAITQKPLPAALNGGSELA